ncbi:hypothetical protein KUTeg_024693 [Tegillarca granosa]|uniref:START domain-containing protein n=1 Tax=Tegillarca granosa TaxID=220873 RepID=A0ABQ9DYT7_TEGGR|nr:hypothetical protein KUTeg_024693 [Tegillarca granosa]
MEIGEVRVAEDTDFLKLKSLCEDTEGWKQEYNKQNVSVWTKNNDVSSFKMVKVRAVFTDFNFDVLYDVLHDSDYRKQWDHVMLEGYEICSINPNNDIGYYAMKCPSPLKNRDFITQRSWLHLGSEFYIFNHSVIHSKYPPKKGFIRGTSYLTGYFVRKLSENSCQFTYVSQSDPKGHLPSWVVNKATKILAPKVIGRIHKACINYPRWKSANNPGFKPWLFPEQVVLPRLDMNQIGPASEFASTDSIDESNIKETEINEDDVTDML